MSRTFSRRIRGTTPYYNFIRRVAFPSTKSIVVNSALMSTLGLGASFLIASRNLPAFLTGVLWGLVGLVVPSFGSDLLLHFTLMKKDPLFYLRRCLALSQFSLMLVVAVFIVSAFISTIDPRFIFPDFAIVVGLFALIPPRVLAVFSMSRTGFGSRTVFALLEPTVIVLSAILVFSLSPVRMFSGLLLASTVGLVFAFGLITAIEVNGRRSMGFSPVRMFRAFLSDWLEGKNGELESYLNELGVGVEVDAAAIAFRKKGDNGIKAAMLVSNIHPGPFLNIGSSVMPFLFGSVMRERFGAVALVPHGVSGHELNLVSQEQNERILSWVLSNLAKASYSDLATSVERSKNDVATATSQVFNGCALVTMTTSPLDMEDVPSELSNNLSGLTQGKFRSLALVDAHNSLSGPATMTQQKVGALQEAALASLQVTAQHQPSSFRIGAAHAKPGNFTLGEGFGPAGISVIATEVAGRRFAYVCIDGNNMIRGLREEILRRLSSLGFDDGEVMTTDTHMVNGVVPAPLGYHPVGEVSPWGSVVEHVSSVCKEALGNLEEAEVGVVAGQIPVTTLGQKSLRRVMRTVYRTSKLTALTLFPMVVICTVLSLLFLV